MDKSGETVVTRDEDTSTPPLANRLFVEFYIPPPPSDTTESESSESETTTQDGGFEISGLGSAMNIFDVSERVIRGNTESKAKSRRRVDASKIIDLRSVMEDPQDSQSDSDSSSVDVGKDKQSHMTHVGVWSGTQPPPVLPAPGMMKLNRSKSLVSHRSVLSDSLSDGVSSLVSAHPSSMPHLASEHLSEASSLPLRDHPHSVEKKLSPIPETHSPTGDPASQLPSSKDKSSEVVLVKSSSEQSIPGEAPHPPATNDVNASTTAGSAAGVLDVSGVLVGETPEHERSPLHSPRQEEHASSRKHSHSPHSHSHSPVQRAQQEHVSLSQRIMSPRIDIGLSLDGHSRDGTPGGMSGGMPNGGITNGMTGGMTGGMSGTGDAEFAGPLPQEEELSYEGVVVRRRAPKLVTKLSTTPIPCDSISEEEDRSHEPHRRDGSGSRFLVPKHDRRAEELFEPVRYEENGSGEAFTPMGDSESSRELEGSLVEEVVSPLDLESDVTSELSASTEEERNDDDGGGEKRLRRVGRFGKSSLIEDVRTRQWREA